MSQELTITTAQQVHGFKSGLTYILDNRGGDLTIEEWREGAWLETIGSPIAADSQKLYIPLIADVNKGVRLTSSGTSSVIFSETKLKDE